METQFIPHEYTCSIIDTWKYSWQTTWTCVITSGKVKIKCYQIIKAVSSNWILWGGCIFVISVCVFQLSWPNHPKHLSDSGRAGSHLCPCFHTHICLWRCAMSWRELEHDALHPELIVSSCQGENSHQCLCHTCLWGEIPHRGGWW